MRSREPSVAEIPYLCPQCLPDRALLPFDQGDGVTIIDGRQKALVRSERRTVIIDGRFVDTQSPAPAWNDWGADDWEWTHYENSDKGVRQCQCCHRS